MHGWSLNLAEMSTLVTEVVRCCSRVTQLVIIVKWHIDWAVDHIL